MTKDMGQLVNLSVRRGIPFKDTAGFIVLLRETGSNRPQSVKSPSVPHLARIHGSTDALKGRSLEVSVTGSVLLDMIFHLEKVGLFYVKETEDGEEHFLTV